ncbi:cryptochrome/photolyase family protein [Planotetraspora kaengkrachanensis]|uniref:Deoxyribodipyrimidine photo-lyase n=1 Tax=Planotetraspora kaengkrachanensis TaxID=575193 RepID=A0A8J3VB01_9ACTN|nr:deoxyribodipyrimidine photo-lyase [Planotetraspora kaengkrachanensis]GIG83608.1 deoxyribodipyrimidine photo-lyase [Planotetraspora kaengkrachanensis]
METVIVLLTRDLRVHDNPALAEACEQARQVVPLFVVDPAIEPRHRADFLRDALHDLRSRLRELGGDLVVRHGDPVAEAIKLARQVEADGIWAAADVSAFARRREERLADACAGERLDFRLYPGLTVVPPGDLVPIGGDHYRVFTPYWRAWSQAPKRRALDPPTQVRLPAKLDTGSLPQASRKPFGLLKGGETEGRRHLDAWLRGGLAGYADGRDLAAGRTSMLSPYLRFGCVSPIEVVTRSAGRPGGEEYVRQLCWRDFYYQVAHAFPELPRRDYRPRRAKWEDDEEAAEAWRRGMTGVPIVDAGMRQLQAEGWMHNRLRMIVGSFLTKRLGIDWRVGADHFNDLLLDADIPNNCGNWQWVAGTGNDTRPNRVLNPLRQAKKVDPEGECVRRYVPELADLPGSVVHEPWRHPARVPGYPAPMLNERLLS